MESLRIDNVIKTLRLKQIDLFTYQNLWQIFPSISESGLSAAISRLIKTKTIPTRKKSEAKARILKIHLYNFSLKRSIFIIGVMARH